MIEEVAMASEQGLSLEGSDSQWGGKEGRWRGVAKGLSAGWKLEAHFLFLFMGLALGFFFFEGKPQQLIRAKKMTN